MYLFICSFISSYRSYLHSLNLLVRPIQINCQTNDKITVRPFTLQHGKKHSSCEEVSKLNAI